MLTKVHDIVREAEINWLQGTNKLGKYVERNTHEIIETIDAYTNHKHISGSIDSLGREKPFFNIVTAAENIWYRATDIDRKDIKFIPKTLSSTVLAFVANVMLQNWMDENRYGQFLNTWGRTLARYGSAVVEYVEQDGKLIPLVIPWNRLIPDAVDFYATPTIKKLYRTPAQLRKNKFYNQDAVDKLVEALETRKNLEGQTIDNQSSFIEIYEVKGEMDSRLLEEQPNLNLKDKDIKYRWQMHAISFVESKDAEFNDFTLYKGRLSKNPTMITHLIEEDGTVLSKGAVEHLFDAQWMANHTVKNMKDTLDIASRLIFQTADTRYTGRNILSAIETGDIFIHAVNMPLTRVANDKPDISAQQNFQMMWQNIGRELTNTPNLTRGISQPQPLTYGLGQILNNNSNSLFEIMTENKGLSLEDQLKEYVVPKIRKQLKNKKEVLGILDAAGIDEIDAMYVPKQAIKNYNNRTAESMFSLLEGKEPSQVMSELQPFNQQAEEQGVRQELGKLGNKRSFVPDEAGEKQWDELFSDFEWGNIRVEITNENADKQAVMQTLATLYTTTAQTDPVKANLILSRIMTETGVFSQIEFSTVRSSPVASNPPVGGGMSALPELSALTK